MRCEDAIRDLPLLLYGELSFEQEETLEQHLEGCPPCRSELAKVRSLQEAIDSAEVDLPAGLLSQCRRDLRTHIQTAAAAAPAARRSSLAIFRDLFAGDWTAWLKPAGAVALLAIGFFGARLADREAARETEPLLPAVTREEPVASRVRFVEPEQNGRVRIILDETRQRVLSGNPGDEDIRRLLLTAARESSDPGLRVDSVDLLSNGADSIEVRRALLYALQHDANPGVRLKAIDGLRSSAADPETRKALARVLLADDNPGVRTQAIDLLIQRQGSDVVGVLQEALKRDDNNYVRLKCQKALHDLRASAESF